MQNNKSVRFLPPKTNINRYKSSFLPSVLWVLLKIKVQFKMVSVRSEKPICAPPSSRSFLTGTVAVETVPVFVWLTMALSPLFKKDRLALRLSTPLSSRRSVVWCPWFCACRQCLKLLNTSDLPRSESLVRVALPASLFARSFPFTPACPRLYIRRSF